jgi:hypothetical protein
VGPTELDRRHIRGWLGCAPNGPLQQHGLGLVRRGAALLPLAAERGRDLATGRRPRPSLQAATVALGYTFGHAEETLTALPATQFEAETPELVPGEWVIQVLRASYSSEDTPVHAPETVCAATRYVFPIGQVTDVEEF